MPGIKLSIILSGRNKIVYIIIIIAKFNLFTILFFNLMYINIPGKTKASTIKNKGKKIIIIINVKMNNRNAKNR